MRDNTKEALGECLVHNNCSVGVSSWQSSTRPGVSHVLKKEFINELMSEWTRGSVAYKT